MLLSYLICNKEFEKLNCEIHYRCIICDNLDDVIMYELIDKPGDFFEIMIWLNDNKILSLVFDLDEYIIGVELRERERKKFNFFVKEKLQWDFLYIP